MPSTGCPSVKRISPFLYKIFFLRIATTCSQSGTQPWHRKQLFTSQLFFVLFIVISTSYYFDQNKQQNIARKIIIRLFFANLTVGICFVQYFCRTISVLLKMSKHSHNSAIPVSPSLDSTI